MKKKATQGALLAAALCLAANTATATAASTDTQNATNTATATTTATAATTAATTDEDWDAWADSILISLPTVDIVSNRATAKTPVAFTNVDKQQLMASNDGRDLTYLLSATPSVVTTSDAGAGMGYTSMRVRGSDGTRINFMVNGVPLNDGESGVTYFVNMPDLASSLRDVQIQRGVGTSANGAGAFGASVNMLTDAPSEQSYAQVSGAYGMYDTNRETLRVGSGLLGGHWSFDARVSHLGSDGYIDRASSKLWSYFGQAAYSSRNTNVRLLAFGGKEQTYMAWDYASKEEMEKYGRRYNPCGKYTADDGQTAFYPDQKDYFEQHHFQIHLAQRINDYWRLNLALHYTDDYGHYEQLKTKRTLKEYGLEPYVNADGEKVKKSDLVRLKFNDNGFGGGVFALNYLRDRLEATLGGGVSHFHGHHFGRVAWVRNYLGPINPLQQYYSNVGNKLDANLYLRANYDLSRTLSAFADVQWRHIHYTIDGVTDTYDYSTEAPQTIGVDRRWNFFNPKAGVNFISGANRAFASVSVAHKEPVRDNFTDGDQNPLHQPQAERLIDYELGYTFARRLFSLGVNLYYMDYRDQLVLTGQLSDTGNPLTVNTPRSYRMGAELQGGLRPCGWFDWQLNVALSRNRIKDFTEYVYEDEWTNPIALACGSTPIAFSPDMVLNNALNFHVGGFEASFDSQWVSRQYMNNARSAEAELPAYFVSNLHLGYEFRKIAAMKSLRVGFSIYNIFNNHYCSNGYAGAGYTVGADGKPEIYRYAGYAAQAPCHVMGTVTMNF